jgi:hypothetical protein
VQPAGMRLVPVERMIEISARRGTFTLPGLSLPSKFILLSNRGF